ncbi:MAG: gfo/Idh/MocA family oxidoreductase [Desulfobacteraceae bacterium]|nr:MAG: gfo/Idh/MocA family oxidoreductase [Desulfobacteraceae bacterium]
MFNIGIIGCGYWGPNLLRNFNSLEGCRMKMACDLDADRLAHMKSLYSSIETRNDYNQVINSSEIDAVVVATPVRFHYEIAKASLEAGKHVFIEKPMASSVEECMELIEIAENRKLIILVGHTFIYSPAVRKIREIVSHGDLGEIQYISARRLNLGLFQTDINVTWDLAPHDISIILYVMGKNPVSVNCHGKAHVNRNIEDVTSMVLNFENGAFATVQSSWLDPNKVREMTFVGSKRMLVYNDVEPIEKIKIYDKRVETPPHYDTFAEFHYSYHYGDMYAPYLKQYEPLKIECQHFIDCIKSGKKPETSGYDGYRVVEILEASLESLRREGAKILIGESKLQRPTRLQSVANLSAARAI